MVQLKVYYEIHYLTLSNLLQLQGLKTSASPRIQFVTQDPFVRGLGLGM